MTYQSAGKKRGNRSRSRAVRRSRCNSRNTKRSCNRVRKGSRKCSWVKGKSWGRRRSKGYCRKMRGGAAVTHDEINDKIEKQINIINGLRFINKMTVPKTQELLNDTDPNIDDYITFISKKKDDNIPTSLKNAWDRLLELKKIKKKNEENREKKLTQGIRIGPIEYTRKEYTSDLSPEQIEQSESEKSQAVKHGVLLDPGPLLKNPIIVENLEKAKKYFKENGNKSFHPVFQNYNNERWDAFTPGLIGFNRDKITLTLFDHMCFIQLINDEIVFITINASSTHMPKDKKIGKGVKAFKTKQNYENIYNKTFNIVKQNTHEVTTSTTTSTSTTTDGTTSSTDTTSTTTPTSTTTTSKSPPSDKKFFNIKPRRNIVPDVINLYKKITVQLLDRIFTINLVKYLRLLTSKGGEIIHENKNVDNNDAINFLYILEDELKIYFTKKKQKGKEIEYSDFSFEDNIVKEWNDHTSIDIKKSQLISVISNNNLKYYLNIDKIKTEINYLNNLFNNPNREQNQLYKIIAKSWNILMTSVTRKEYCLVQEIIKSKYPQMFHKKLGIEPHDGRENEVENYKKLRDFVVADMFSETGSQPTAGFLFPGDIPDQYISKNQNYKYYFTNILNEILNLIYIMYNNANVVVISAFETPGMKLSIEQDQDFGKENDYFDLIHIDSWNSMTKGSSMEMSQFIYRKNNAEEVVNFKNSNSLDHKKTIKWNGQNFENEDEDARTDIDQFYIEYNGKKYIVISIHLKSSPNGKLDTTLFNNLEILIKDYISKGINVILCGDTNYNAEKMNDDNYNTSGHLESIIIDNLNIDSISKDDGFIKFLLRKSRCIGNWENNQMEKGGPEGNYKIDGMILLFFKRAAGSNPEEGAAGSKPEEGAAGSKPEEGAADSKLKGGRRLIRSKCSKKQKRRSCRRSKRCSWVKKSKRGSRGHCRKRGSKSRTRRRSKNRSRRK